MKEVRASAPVEEADIDAELAAGSDEPDLEEEDAAGDMGGDDLELSEPCAECEAQHSQASIQHSSGRLSSMLISAMHSLMDRSHVRLLKQCACGGDLRTDKVIQDNHLLWTR